MAATWREERPEAITAASHKAERPSRSMVTIFSALSSSSEAITRLSSSLCGAAFAAGLGCATFFLAGDLLLGLAGLVLAGLAGDFFLAGAFFAAFLGAAFLAAGFLAGAFLAFRVLTPGREAVLSRHQARLQGHANDRGALRMARSVQHQDIGRGGQPTRQPKAPHQR